MANEDFPDADEDDAAPQNQADASQYRPHSVAEDEEVQRESENEFADRVEPDMSDAGPHADDDAEVDPQLQIDRIRPTDVTDRE